MARPRLQDIKPDFLRFIDLLHRCRLAEIGERGRTRITLPELNSILIGPVQLNEFLDRLSTDGVIERPDENFNFRMNESGSFEMESGATEIELFSNYNKGEILAYRFRLLGASAEKQVFRAPNWESITIVVRDEKNVLVSISGTETLDVPATYGTLGFANERTGEPIKDWRLLLMLANHGGQIAKSHPDLLELDDPVQKRNVKKRLQTAFGITSIDPFLPVGRRAPVYKLRFGIKIERPETPENAEQEPQSFFDEEMSRYS